MLRSALKLLIHTNELTIQTLWYRANSCGMVRSHWQFCRCRKLFASIIAFEARDASREVIRPHFDMLQSMTGCLQHLRLWALLIDALTVISLRCKRVLMSQSISNYIFINNQAKGSSWVISLPRTSLTWNLNILMKHFKQWFSSKLSRYNHVTS